MTRRGAIVTGIVFLAVVTLFYVLFRLLLGQMTGDSAALPAGGRDKIGLLEVEGLIFDTRDLISMIKEMEDDRAVKAVVLRIDSPGGGVAASQEVHSALRKLRTAGKPLVASMGSVAASGGYYIACAADTIVANPGTITGSIGVIMEFPQTHELFRRLGIDFEVIKSGPFKDSGSPHREISDVERKYLQGVIDDAYSQFVQAVAAGRRLDLASVRELADGRIFTGKQALQKGLVDVLGSQDDAVDVAAEMVGIKGKPILFRPVRRRREVWSWVFGKLGLPAVGSLPVPRLLYLLAY